MSSLPQEKPEESAFFYSIDVCEGTFCEKTKEDKQLKDVRPNLLRLDNSFAHTPSTAAHAQGPFLVCCGLQ